MSKTFEMEAIGYAPEYINIPEIKADNQEHAENKGMEYVKQFYPELQDVEITKVSVI